MASVITLDGLKAGKLGRKYRKKCKTATAYSPTIGREVEVCVGSAVATKGRSRKPQRKKTKSRVSCKVTRVVRNKKSGRKMCFCTKPKHQILPNSECGLPAPKKKGK